MNNNETIKSARREYYDKNHEKMREYARNRYHSCDNKEKAKTLYERDKEKFQICAKLS